MERSQLALRCLLSEPRVVSTHPPLLILLHGYGSNEEDLFSLADGFPPELLVISVRAPRTLTLGHYAWFSIDFSSGTPVNDQIEAEESRIILKQFIDEAVAAFHVDTKRVFMLGFSQGAIMSYSVALTNPGLIKGVAALSGRVLKEIRPLVAESDELGRIKLFIGHGTEDTVLRIDFAREAKEYLMSLGLAPEYHEYPIGHGISKEELGAVVGWLREVVANRE